MSREIRSLGYVGFETSRLDAWRMFVTELLGLEVSDFADDGVLRLRMDDNAYRIAIHPGDREDISYAGWEVADGSALASRAPPARQRCCRDRRAASARGCARNS